MTQEIIVSISPQGEVGIEANGFNGIGCTAATEQLEVVLGGGAQKRRRDYKPEFSLPNASETHTKNTF